MTIRNKSWDWNKQYCLLPLFRPSTRVEGSDGQDRGTIGTRGTTVRGTMESHFLGVAYHFNQRYKHWNLNLKVGLPNFPNLFYFSFQIPYSIHESKDLRNLRGKNGIFAAGFLKFAKLGVCYAAKNWKICKITRMLCGDKNKLKTSFFYCYIQSVSYNLNHVDFLSYIT